jgi:hypothetical protein
MQHEHSRSSPGQRWNARSRWALYGFLAVAGFYLVTEHWAHTLSALPFLILLLCPLLHFFHHGGHGDRGSNPDANSGKGKGGPS